MMWFKFEEALKTLIQHFPAEAMKKPTLFHSVRVWTYLWNHGYSEELQIAGLLHDALEDTNIWETVIQESFWTYVLNIVKANSKNNNVSKSEILEDIVQRCSLIWEDAMIIKMADIYDNFLFYKKENNISEIKRCKILVELVKKYKNSEWNDKIFKKINIILEY